MMPNSWKKYMPNSLFSLISVPNSWKKVDVELLVLLHVGHRILNVVPREGLVIVDDVLLLQ